MIIEPTYTNIPALSYRATYKSYFVAYGRTANEAIANCLEQIEVKRKQAEQLLNNIK